MSVRLSLLAILDQGPITLSLLVSVVVLTVGCWLVFILGLKLTIPLWPRFMQ